MSNASSKATLCSDPWPPFIIGEVGKNAIGGIAVEILRIAFSRIGEEEPEFPLYNWARCLENIKDGKESGVNLALSTPERREYISFSHVMFYNNLLIWYSPAFNPDGIHWETVDDLAKYKIGLTRGYSMGDEFDLAKKEGRLQVFEVREDSQNLEKIQLGRIDFVIINELIGRNLIERKNLAGAIISMDKPFLTEPFYMGFSRKSPWLSVLPKLNEVLDNMHKDGTIEAILSAE